MKNIIMTSFFFFLFFICTSISLFSQSIDIALKDPFNNLYPKYFVFRGEYNNPQHQSYEAWKSIGVNADGVIKKWSTYDELPNIKPVSIDYAKLFSQEFPSKLMLLHWTCRAHRNDQPGSYDRYFPGHWVGVGATQLKSDIETTDTIIYVYDTSVLSNYSNNTSDFTYPVLRINKLDNSGNPIWDQTEYMYLKQVDKNTNSIIVERGTVGTIPLSFPTGSRIGGMDTRLSNKGLFFYNMRIDSPRDSQGKNAADIQLEELASFLSPETPFPFIDGISFDVMEWEAPSTRNDTDNDGIADGGFLGNINKWREGVIDFQKKMRELLGDRIMTADAYMTKDQRGIGLMNGNESEGLVRHNDAYRGIAKSINIFNFWNNRNSLSLRVPYVIPKLENESDSGISLLRLANSFCAIMNIGIASPSPDSLADELFNGEKNTQNWLGRPIGQIVYPGMDASDLLDGKGVVMSSDFVSKWISTTAKASKDGDVLKLTPEFQVNEFNFTLENFRYGTSGKDILISFEIKSNSIADGFPRVISASASGLPAFENTARNNNMYNDLWGYFDDKDYTQLYFYYRHSADLPLNITFTIEGGTTCSIRNFTIRDQPLIMAREFENGFVLFNPSFESYEFDFYRIFDGQTGKRIQGIVDQLYNNGEYIKKNKVMLLPLNGLFLEKIGCR